VKLNVKIEVMDLFAPNE